MDHGGHASFVDYDGQVFIPILNITFPFWSAFYCTIAQITYLQNQAQKHNTVWQEKMIPSLLFISKCYLKMIVCRADWARVSTKRSIQRSFEATFLGFVTWWSLVMKTLLFDAFGRTKFFSAALIEFHVLDKFLGEEGSCRRMKRVMIKYSFGAAQIAGEIHHDQLFYVCFTALSSVHSK